MNSSKIATLIYPIKNTLLHQLTPIEFSRLAPSLKIVVLETTTVLNCSINDTRYAYFPIDSIISLFKVDAEGNTNQIAMIGNEGMVGISLLTNSQEVVSAMVQKQGLALRIARSHLVNEFNRQGVLFNEILVYLQHLIAQIAQTVVCNRLHSVEQQLCRWLLLTLDRSTNNQIRMTQEGISLCLGVRRGSISEASGKLHRLGVLNYSRGEIQVINRQALEVLSCDCYAQDSAVYCNEKLTQSIMTI